MDSNRLLSEISGLTRNLESLVKEIRESNKINTSSQKAISQIVDSDKKSEKSSESKISEVSGKEKSPSKNQDKFFSKLMTTIEKRFSEGNQILKESSLKTLEEAGKSILSARSSGKNVESILKNAGKKSLVNFAISKTPEAVSMLASKIKKSQELKEKEKAKKEDSVTLTPTREEKIRSRREKREERRKEILSNREEKSRKEKSEEKKISLQKITEKIIQREKNPTSDNTPTEKTEPEKKPVSEEVKKIPSLVETSKTPKVEKEEMGFKKAAKEAFLKTELGSTVQKISTLIKKEKSPSAEGEDKNKPKGIKSKMSLLFQKKETQKTPEATKETSGSTPSEVSVSTGREIPAKLQNDTSSTESKIPVETQPKGDGSSMEEVITQKDIQDIKALLSAINSSLNSPLRIKENKPFRPKSNMLE